MADLYSGQMLSAVTDMSYGILAIVPKYADGTPITDFEDVIITENGRELKAWDSIARYMASFADTDGDGIANVPAYYSTTHGRKLVDTSRTPPCPAEESQQIHRRLRRSAGGGGAADRAGCAADPKAGQKGQTPYRIRPPLPKGRIGAILDTNTHPVKNRPCSFVCEKAFLENALLRQVGGRPMVAPTHPTDIFDTPEYSISIALKGEQNMESEKIILDIVVDVQKDFITGALANPAAQANVAHLADTAKAHAEAGHWMFFTRDTHPDNYLETREGRHLPVEHCIEGEDGWNLAPELENAMAGTEPAVCRVINKATFGSYMLPSDILDELMAHNKAVTDLEKIVIYGYCTDICVISNAMVLRAAFPETEIEILSDCCAGVTPDTHRTALDAMRACQFTIL